jgi:hypothetical protein
MEDGATENDENLGQVKWHPRQNLNQGLANKTQNYNQSRWAVYLLTNHRRTLRISRNRTAQFPNFAQAANLSLLTKSN